MSTTDSVTYCQVKETSQIATNILLIIYFLFCGLSVMSILVIMIKYIFNHAKRRDISKPDSGSNRAYYIMFFICTIITISLFPVQFYLICFPSHYQLLSNGVDLFWSLSMLLHNTILIKCFYHRLNSIFHATSFELTTFTKKVYTISIIIVFMIGVISLIFVGIGLLQGYLAGFVYLIGFFGYVIYLLSLTILLVQKLIKAYHSHNDQVFLDHVIKAIILISTSLSITCLRAIIGIWYFYSTNLLYVEWISYYIAFIDTYTNCICVIFFWRKYGKSYRKLCQCMEFVCKSLCFGKYLMEGDIKHLTETVEQSHTKTNAKLEIGGVSSQIQTDHDTVMDQSIDGVTIVIQSENQIRS